MENKVVKQRVLNDPVFYPEKFSERARSICEGLLVKEPQRRLGFRNGSCDELRAHSFFSQINWRKLNAGPFQNLCRKNCFGGFILPSSLTASCVLCSSLCFLCANEAAAKHSLLSVLSEYI